MQGDAIGLLFSSTTRFSLKVRLNYLFSITAPWGSTIRMNLLYIKCCIFFSPELNKITIASIRILINSSLNLTSRRLSRLYSFSPSSPSLFLSHILLYTHTYIHAHANTYTHIQFSIISLILRRRFSPPFNNNHFTHSLHMLVLSMERIN